MMANGEMPRIGAHAVAAAEHAAGGRWGDISGEMEI